MRIRELSAVRRPAAVGTALAVFLTAAPLASRTQTGPAAQASESPIEIAHDPLACMTPVLAPEVDAGVTPGTDYDRGYVYFRAAGTEDYYYIRMAGPPETLAGILPRPLPETRAVDYYLRAYDVAQASKRKGDWTPPVVPGTTCKTRGIPVGPAGAGLTVGLTREGQNPRPPGFNEKDIAKVILVSGAVVTLAEALKAAQSTAASSGGSGGGISTGAAVAGGVVVAGAVVAAVAAGDDDPNPTATPTRTATPTPTIPVLRFVQADATWSGVGNVDVQIVNASGQAVGQTLPAGCESTASRTERVVVQGVVPAGTYRVALTGVSCGAGTPSAISAVASVQSDAGQKCASTFVSVPVGGNATACTFTVP
jgi:hypothetical protein